MKRLTHLDQKSGGFREPKKKEKNISKPSNHSSENPPSFNSFSVNLKSIQVIKCTSYSGQKIVPSEK